MIDPWNPSRNAMDRVKDPLPAPAKCDSCGGSVRIAHHREIYGGRSFGDWPWMYVCDCGARVGMHPGTNIPLGTMADEATRHSRKVAKPIFEKVWKDGYMSRTDAYRWLAEQMGIPTSKCHFGMFSSSRCHQARKICTSYLRTQS